MQSWCWFYSKSEALILEGPCPWSKIPRVFYPCLYTFASFSLPSLSSYELHQAFLVRTIYIYKLLDKHLQTSTWPPLRAWLVATLWPFLREFSLFLNSSANFRTIELHLPNQFNSSILHKHSVLGTLLTKCWYPLFAYLFVNNLL